jgi:hypothetical protein
VALGANGASRPGAPPARRAMREVVARRVMSCCRSPRHSASMGRTREEFAVTEFIAIGYGSLSPGTGGTWQRTPAAPSLPGWGRFLGRSIR